ncbi:hypothetical protein [Blastococcus litoris]|uniref:hypothetical protein n=1 Tax=Blastococcus litoris TaxID=2171622 RepID=UPI0013DFD0F2|nr:hypothetical protein [Blastococcus litoris]
MLERARVVPDGPGPDRSGAGSRRWRGSRLLLAGVVLLLLLQLAVRIWMVSRRGLYGDDLHYGVRALELPLFSADLLLEQHGGHFMPGALLMDALLTRVAPLEWWPLAAALIVLQAVASLVVLRLLRLLVGDRAVLLLPFAVYLFSPLNLGFFAWWSAAMNSLPLQIGLAWVLGDAVQFLRTGRRRYVVTGTVAVAVTLLFYERAVLVPLVAFGLVAVLLSVGRPGMALGEAWRRCRPLWLGCLGVVAVWLWAFTSSVPSEVVGSATVSQVAGTTQATLRAPLSSLLGGPWAWTSGPPDTPHIAPPGALVVAAVLALGVLVVWTSVRREGAGALWMLLGGYLLAGAVLVALGRGIFGTGELLPLTYRYHAGEVVLLAVVLGLVAVLPRRGSGAAPLDVDEPARTDDRHGTPARVAVLVLTGAFLVSSLVSTVTYVDLWGEHRTTDYLATVEASMAGAADGEPLLDQPVAEDVLNGLFYPSNQMFRLFEPLPQRPEFAEATHDLRMLDDAGQLRPARVEPGIELADGPEPSCGWAVPSGGTVSAALDGPVFDWVWTAELAYEADRDGVITVSLGSDSVSAPVRQGQHTVYVRLVGGGDALVVGSEADGPDLCLSSGVVGNIALR